MILNKINEIKNKSVFSDRISETNLYLFNINYIEEEVFYLTNLLSSKERNYINKLKNDKSLNKYIIRRGLLRLILSDYLNLEPKDIPIIRDTYNKPEITDISENLNFNISHSREHLLIGVNCKKQLGVDVECIDSFRFKNSDLCNTIFSEQELILYKLLDYKTKKCVFLKEWVIKESIVKAIGVGLTIDLRSIKKISYIDGFQYYKFKDFLVKVKFINTRGVYISLAELIKYKTREQLKNEK